MRRPVLGDDSYPDSAQFIGSDEQFERDRILFSDQFRYLLEHSPFYRKKLHDAGVSEKIASDLRQIARLPFTEKTELRASQSNHPPFGDYLAAPTTSIRRVYSTSGTTGEPCYIPLTTNDLESFVHISAQTYYATGVRPGMSVLSTYNAGPFVAGIALDALGQLGACHIPIGTGNTTRLLRALIALKPDVLLCTPSYAMYLSEQLEEDDISRKDLTLKRICVAGEPGGSEPAVRTRLEDAFGAVVCEAMGLADISASLWGECDEQQGMHFSGRGYVYFELIDPDTGRPVDIADGAEGEIVYTALRREAAPVLRFRSRDHVRCYVSPCGCGRSTPRVQCVGRTDDMLIVRGVNIFPSAVRSVIGQFAPRVSGAILVRPMTKSVRQEPPLPVDVELGRGEAASPGLAQAIEQAVRAQLIVTIRASLVPFGSLPRSEYKTGLVLSKDISFGDAVSSALDTRAGV